jgi:dGTPase
MKRAVYVSLSHFHHQPQLDPILGSERQEDKTLKTAKEVVHDYSRFKVEARYASQGDNRSLFEKDRDKIAASAFFNRLQHVTQVEHSGAATGERKFAIQHYQSRLTHTLEVSRYAVRIAKNLQQRQQDLCTYYGGLDLYIAEACSMAHDLGHPPYGHVCEKLLAFAMRELGGFEGNAQTFRILSVLESRGGTGFLQLSRRTWASCLKYPWTNIEATTLGTSKYSVYDLRMGDQDDPDDADLTSDKWLFDWIYHRPDSPSAIIGSAALTTVPEAESVEELGEELVTAAELLGEVEECEGLVQRIRTPEAEIMDYADDVAYATSDFCEALQTNEGLFALAKDWEKFKSFVETNLDLFTKTLRGPFDLLQDAVPP